MNEKHIQWQLSCREDLLRNKEVPTQSELFKSLGEPLGLIILETMKHPLSKEFICSTNKSASISLSSQIDKKPCLVPVTHSEVTKACVHQGILEIGKQVEEKFEQAYKELIQKACNDGRNFERFECERRMNFLLNYEREKHHLDINEIRKECHVALETERNAFVEKHIICIENESVPKEEKGIQTDVLPESKKRPFINQESTKMSAILNTTFERLHKVFKDHLRIYCHLLTCSNIDGKFNNEIICKMVKNIKESLGKTLINDPQQKLPLSNLENKISPDIEFDENLCDFCKQHYQNTLSCKLIGSIVYPKTYGDEIFCTCYSSSQESDKEFFQEYSKYQVTENDALNTEWSTVSENSFKKEESLSYSTSRSTDSEITSGYVPLASDIAMAKKIVSLVNIDLILKKVFDKMLCYNSERLHHEIREFVRKELSYVFNEESVLKTIEEITNKRKQSFILGAADSLELLRAKRSTKFDIPDGEAESATPAGPVDSHSFSSIVEKFSSHDFRNTGLHLSTSNNNEQEKLNSPKEMNNDLLHLQKYNCVENQFSSHWLYRECTDEEWNKLLQHICQRMTTQTKKNH